MLVWMLATIHLLALGIGLGAIVARAAGLRTASPGPGLRTVFFADAMWGLAALLWISTGLWRAFGGIEKGSSYYLGSTAFWIKMSLLLGVLILEIRPMLTLIRWRMAFRDGDEPDLSLAPALARISVVQAGLVVAMAFAATAMARGIG